MRSGAAQRAAPLSCTSSSINSGLRHVLGRGALGALDDVELHRVTLGEGLETVALDRAVVHEAVFLAAVGGDEAETLRVVEPLHLAGRTHIPTPEKTDCLGSGTRRTPTIASAAGAPVSRRDERQRRAIV